MRARVGDEFFHVLRGNRGMHQHEVRRIAEQCDRREMADRIVSAGVCRRRNGMRAGGAQRPGVAIGRGARSDLNAYRSAAAGTVIDDDLLAELFGGALRYQTRHGIGRTTRWKRNHKPDGTFGKRCVRAIFQQP